MAKVRWSQYCAGGCGTWLQVGDPAHHLHGGWWCGDCYRKHAAFCSRTVRA